MYPTPFRIHFANSSAVAVPRSARQLGESTDLSSCADALVAALQVSAGRFPALGYPHGYGNLKYEFPKPSISRLGFFPWTQPSSYWGPHGFHELNHPALGVPPVIIHVHEIFHEINYPAIGVAPFMETSIDRCVPWYSHYFPNNHPKSPSLL